MATRAIQIGFLISGITSASTGEPVAGGTVYFYEAGTTTAKYIYTEKEKTNGYYSYSLDAIGAAHLYGDGEYKVVVKDADDATVKTLDYIRLEYPVYAVDTVSTTPYTHSTDNDLLLVDTTSTAITINCLAAASWERPLKVFRTAGSNNITIDPSSTETIDGSATLTISSDAIVEIVSDGSNLHSVGFRADVADQDNDTKIQVEETSDDDTIRFDTGGTERVTITTTKVTSTLPIQVNAHQDADADTKVQVEESSDEDIIRFDTAGSERMQIGATGNVGIGKTSGGAKLDVDGEVEATALDINGNADVSGTANIHDTLTLSKASGNGLVVTAAIDANSTADIADTLTLSKATGNGLVVTADADINGSADVAGTLTGGTFYPTTLKVNEDVAVAATATEINSAADGIGVTIPRQKIVNIGDWNMDSDESVSVAHGLTFAKIVGLRGGVINDIGNTLTPICWYQTTTATAAQISASVIGNNVVLNRLAGGIFDGTDYDATSYNRGYLILDYID